MRAATKAEDMLASFRRDALHKNWTHTTHKQENGVHTEAIRPDLVDLEIRIPEFQGLYVGFGDLTVPSW